MRPLRALLAAGVVASALVVVPGAGPAPTPAQENEKIRVLVGDAVTSEVAGAGGAGNTLFFPVTVVAPSEGVPPTFSTEGVTFSYSTALGPGDTAEAADFTPVSDQSVTIRPRVGGPLAGIRAQVVPSNSLQEGSFASPVQVAVRADDPTVGDDALETLTVTFEAPEGSNVELVRTSAKGFIVDEDATATTATHCALEASTATLAVVVGATTPDPHALAFAREPGSAGLVATLTPPGQAPRALACGSPTVSTVDTVAVLVEGRAPFALTFDLSQGPLGPGRNARDANGDGRDDQVGTFDLYGAGFAEDDDPEIEFDVHLPAATPGHTLTVMGSAGADRVVAGATACPQEARGPICRALRVNLNAAAGADADVGLDQSPATVIIEGGGGADTLSAQGSAGTGAPLPGPVTLLGGPGADSLVGGNGNDTVAGGAGDDVVAGGDNTKDSAGGFNGGDALYGDCPPPTVESGCAGSGDDVVDEGTNVNGRDVISGGDGRDAVDYAKRLRTVIAQPGPNHPPRSGHAPPADDGEANELDTVLADVEDVRLPALGGGEGAGGVRVVGELSAPTACPVLGLGGVDRTGPCPLVVDPVNQVGIAVGARFSGNETSGTTTDEGVFVYDLKTLAPPIRIPKEECPHGKGGAVLENINNPDRVDHDEVNPVIERSGGGLAFCGYFPYATVDSAHGRLYASIPMTGSGPISANCGLVRYSYQRFPAQVPTMAWARYTGCLPPAGTSTDATAYLPDGAGRPKARPLIHLNLAWDDALGGLYAAGAYHEDKPTRRLSHNSGYRFPTDFPFENLGQPLVVRQVRPGPDDPTTAAVEDLAYGWDLDLRYAGCGRRVTFVDGDPPLAQFVARVGDDLLAYCWDPKPMSGASRFSFGDQGYLVRIPLDDDDRPLPLVGGTPLVIDANGAFVNYRFVRTPTLSGYLDVVVDRGDDKVVLVTDGAVNGNAAWVFDPNEDRFVGVSSGGAVAQPKNNTAVGIDPVRGRVYMTTQDGLLVVPARSRPLPAGTIYPVGVNVKREADFANLRTIAVLPATATRPARLFLPLNLADQKVACPGPRRCKGTTPVSSDAGARYVVVEDASPEPPATGADPDANTAQLDEAEGITEVRAAGTGLAAGAHVVVTGGLARTVNQANPGCRYQADAALSTGDGPSAGLGAGGSPERGELATITVSFGSSTSIPFFLPFRPFGNDGCAGDQALAPGHRELFLARTAGEAGSASVAEGAPLSFGANDVTATDLKKRGACEGSLVRGMGAQRYAPLPPEMRDHPDFRENSGHFDAAYAGVEGGYGDGCEDFWDGVTNTGRDDHGAAVQPDASDPDPRNRLADPRAGTTGRDGKGALGAAARCADYGSGPAEDRQGQPVLAAAAGCEHATTAAGAAAEAPGLVLSGPEGALVTVVSTSSAVRSFRHPDQGQVTVSLAAARGVVVGPLSIREVRSAAVARAKGRTDTAVVAYERRWCGLTLAAPLGAGEGDPHTGDATKIDGCIDPANPDNAPLIEAINRALVGKVRLSLPDPNAETEPDGTTEAGEDSPGGFQAVLTKHADQRGGDVVVNDDDSHTVAALEATYYNDGAEGRNRVVVQLAAVHAEARYGIVAVPDFSGLGGFDEPIDELTFDEPDGAGPSDHAGPGEAPFGEEGFEDLGRLDELIEGEAFAELVDADDLGAGAARPVRRFLRALPDAVGDVVRLMIQHPREFALLMLVFGLLLAPPYLAYRRRQFADLVAG